MIGRTLAMCAALSLSSLAGAEGATVVTLREAVSRSLASSPALQEAGLEVRIARADADRAELPFDTTFRLRIDAQEGPGIGVDTPTGIEPLGLATGTATVRKVFSTGTGAEIGFGESFLDTPYIYQYLAPQWTTTLRLHVDQQLLRGLRPSANTALIVSAQTREKAARLELAWAAQQVGAQVSSAYWRFAAAREERDIWRRSLDLGVQVQALTEKKIALGSLPLSSRTEANSVVARRRAQLAAATQALEDVRGQLAAAMFVSDPHVELDSSDSLQAPQPPALGGGVDARADVGAARERLVSQRAQSLSASDAALPLLTLGGSLEMYGVSGFPYGDACSLLSSEAGGAAAGSIVASCDPNGIFAGNFGAGLSRTLNGTFYQVFGTLTFEIPLERRGVNGTVQRAELMVRAAEEAVHLREVSAGAEIARLQRLALEDTHRYQAAADAVTAAEQRVTEEQRRYGLGANTTFDVVRVQDELVSTQLLALHARTDAAINRIQLSLAQGRLFDDLGLAFSLEGVPSEAAR